MSKLVPAVFVYGTLQRGELRERSWPRAPRSVRRATLRGQLRDLGEYPALVAGGDLIQGEVWEFDSADMQPTLACLDEIEGYGQDEEDLYVRRVVTCRTLGGEAVEAYSYWFANPSDISTLPLVHADAQGFCRWTAER